MNEDIHTEYSTFNALARPAMVFGVPIMALAVCGMAGVLLTMMTMPILSGSALFFLLLPAPAILFLKSIHTNDDQALKKITAEIRCFFRRKNTRLFNGTATILPLKYGRQTDDYQRFFEKPDSIFGLAAETIPTRQ